MEETVEEMKARYLEMKREESEEFDECIHTGLGWNGGMYFLLLKIQKQDPSFDCVQS